MKVVSSKESGKVSIEDVNEEEMMVFYVLAVEGRMRILSGMEAYHFQNPKKVRKTLDAFYKLAHDWVGTLPLDSPLRKKLFAPPKEQ